MTRLMLSVTILFAIAANHHVAAEVQTESIEYSDGDVSLRGFLAWDDASDQRRPGILVVHEWWGLNDYARGRAKQLAEMGYVAFALDMYGKGKVTEHPKQAGEWATMIRKNADAWRARARAGLKILKQQEQVDPNRLAAIGYCFGGSTVLHLAFGGDDLRGVVSFHGSLPVPTADETARTKSRLLVCHGAADRFIPTEQIGKFQQALDAGGVDWQMVYYAGAKHSFTNPGADAKNIDGIGYNKKADLRSWGHMQAFFDEIFAE